MDVDYLSLRLRSKIKSHNLEKADCSECNIRHKDTVPCCACFRRPAAAQAEISSVEFSDEFVVSGDGPGTIARCLDTCTAVNWAVQDNFKKVDMAVYCKQACK